MKVAILNNDFRVYWKGRLHYLHGYLAGKGTQLNAIELFGKGSPYAFDTVDSGQQWWACLFPGHSAADLDKKEIKKQLFVALDKLQPDVVIGPSIVFYAGALGIAWAKKNKKRFVMFDDARPAQVKRNVVVQNIKDMITAQTDGLWLPAKSYDAAYAQFKNPATEFFYGFSSVDNNLFKPEAGRLYNQKVIICVARLVPIKNLDNLLKAWQQVEEQSTGYRLQIIGNGPEEDALKRLSTDLQLTTVDFTDAVSNDELPGKLHQADGFILPSLSETWGLVVNEAMAAGLPVLLSRNINATHDLLLEGVNGYGFDPYNTEEIVAAILKFIALSDEAKAQMGNNSLKVIDSLSYDRMGAQLLAALKTISPKKYKKPDLLAGAIISLWHGRYNTSGWDKL